MKTRFYLSALLSTGILLSTLNGVAQIIKTRSLAYEIKAFSATPDGRTIALGSKSVTEVLNNVTGEFIGSVTLSGPVTALCLNSHGTMLFIGCDVTQSQLMSWDLVRGIRNYIPNSHRDRILAIAVSTDGKWLATGSKDKTVKLFETRNYTEVMTFKGHLDDVTSLAFSPDSKFLISGSSDSHIILWDLTRNVDLKTFFGHSESVNAVAFSPDGQLIASGSADNFILIWDLRYPEKPKYKMEAHQNGVKCIAFTPDGKFLASGGAEGRFKIWHFIQEKQVPMHMTTGVSHKGSVNFLAFDPERKLITCSTDKTMKYWNWGFPILSIENMVFEDPNNTKKLEGTEKAAIKFKVVNTGEGDALKLVFNVTETKNITGISYEPTYFAGDIPAHSESEVTIPVTAGADLKSATAIFRFTDFGVLSNNPFPLQDTSFTITTVAAPVMVVDSLWFSYPDQNRVLTGRMGGNIFLSIVNKGAGIARNVKVSLKCAREDCGLEFTPESEHGNIGLTENQILKIPVKANSKVANGIVDIDISLADAANISHIDTAISISTKKYEPTLIEEIKETVEYKINAWQKKGKYEKTDNYKLRVTERTRESQIAFFTRQVLDSLVHQKLDWSLAKNEYDPDNESFRIVIPNFDPFYMKIPYSEAPSFDRRFSKLVVDSIRYTVNRNNFAFVHMELVDTATNNSRYVYDSKELIAFNPTLLNFNFDPININLPNNQGIIAANEEFRQITVGHSDVDINIPENSTRNSKIFAVVIGNEDYSSRQPGLRSESNVDFAENDAIAFKKYLLSTYGVPEENIKLLRNATYAEMTREIKWLTSLAESQKGEAELVFYFSGHGLPDELTREGYIMPVDVTGADIRLAISLRTLYSELSKWPTKKVTVFLDACFSGAGRNEGLLALKGAKIRPKDEVISGNMVVFTSSSGEESSGFYKDKQHGMFTYYLLKKIQETRGQIDYQNLINYLRQEVNVRSLILNSKSQNPQIIVSNDFSLPLQNVTIGESVNEQ